MSPDNPRMLQPVNTVERELLLGAGLWTSPDLKETLPPGRFTVVCNFEVKGVVKSVSLRFARTVSFDPVGRTIAVGTLRDCMLPR